MQKIQFLDNVFRIEAWEPRKKSLKKFAYTKKGCTFALRILRQNIKYRYNYGNEKNIPAFSPQENQQARFSSENGYRQRSQSIGGASRKGTQKADRIGWVDIQVRLVPESLPTIEIPTENHREVLRRNFFN